MSGLLLLPIPGGRLAEYTPRQDPLAARPPGREFNRIAFAAAHLAVDSLGKGNPWLDRPAIDRESSIGTRRWLWDQGLHLAEAMDTSQRGMGLDWESASDLIARSAREAKLHPLVPRIACHAGTDHIDPSRLGEERAILSAYELQMEFIERHDCQAILMASRALPAAGASPDSCARIYGRLIEQTAKPVILHWLGPMFDRFLAGMLSARSILHYAGLFRLADVARLLLDPDPTSNRMRTLLALHGIP